MFIHQDVAFLFESLENIEKSLNSLNNLGIAGAAGKIKEEAHVISNMKQGKDSKDVGIPIDMPMKVQTLDECLVIIPKSVFEYLQFDEENCDNWHLYAVDYCLSVKNLKLDVYAIPMYVHHLSNGFPVSSGYFTTMKKLINKHHKHYKWIPTTIGNWNTAYPFIAQKILYKIIFYLDK